MTSAVTPVKVNVAGEEVTIRSEQPAEHSRAVAQYVDDAIRRIQDMSPSVDTGRAALLASLQICDELFRTRADAEIGTERLEQTMEDIRRMLPPAKRSIGR
jgi:cell division protein ZapA